MNLRVVTPEGPLAMSDVDYVEIPTLDGEIGVYPGHARIASSLGAGSLRVYRGEEIDQYAVSGGLVQIGPESVTIIATFGTGTAGGSESDIEEAVGRARTALEDAGGADEIVSEEVALLHAAIGRLAKKSRGSGL